MTRKHFEAIAATIAAMNVGQATRKKIAADFAAMCEQENRNFDHDRFLKACGV